MKYPGSHNENHSKVTGKVMNNLRGCDLLLERVDCQTFLSDSGHIDALQKQDCNIRTVLKIRLN